MFNNRWMAAGMAAAMIVGWGCLQSASAAAPSPAQRLRCEYLADPAAVDSLAPRLSWVVEADRRAEKQTAYQVIVSSSGGLLAAGNGDLWDSGKVASDETTQIAYAGKTLVSEQECFWKVRWWDRAGSASPYSKPAWWKMGLLSQDLWKARWIGKEALPEGSSPAGPLGTGKWVWYPEGNPAVGAPTATRYFRRILTLAADREVKSALFTLTADDGFILYVNGKNVGHSDDQTDSWRRPVTVNLAKEIAAGDNILAIEAHNNEGPAGLAGQLKVQFQAGDPLTLRIDHSWKASQAGPAGWNGRGFDDTAWVAAMETESIGEGPWGDVDHSPSQNLPPPPYLRKTFTLDKPVQKAYLRATALGLYEFHLNGTRVGEDIFTPGWTAYPKRMYYQAYDVTRLVRQGANAIGAILADGWAVGHIGNGGRNRYGLKRPRLYGQLNIMYTDGTTTAIATDGTWKTAYGPVVEGDLLDGESYDARREMPGWDSPEFDEAGWSAVDVYDKWPAKIEAYPDVPVREMMERKSLGETEPSPGAFVYDMGQNMVGWARIKVHGPAGTKIRLRFAEMLNPDKTVYTANMRGARATDYYTLKGAGDEVWAPRFTFHGFRYVELTGLAENPGPDAVTGVVVHSAIPEAGTFECSNPMVNQLQSNIQWGQRGNFLEVPTDCPQRDERCGWMGDAQIFIRTGCYNRDVSAFFTKWMTDVDDARRGAEFTDVSPDVCCGSGTAGWADAGIIIPWTIYQMYGDRRIIESHYPAMAGYIDWMQQHSKGLIRPAQGYGDWLAIGSNTPTDVIATAYFAYSTSLMATMARAIGKEDDAVRYEELFGKIKDAFDTAFVSADGHIKGNSQTDYLLALRFGLLPEDKKAEAGQYLTDDIKGRGWRLSTGFVGVGYMNPTLTQIGRTDVAYRLLNQDAFPSWGFSIKHGATTIWERWDGWTPEHGFQDAGMNSFNHYSLGSVGEWMFRTVGGIDSDPEHPGFKQIRIAPEPGGGLTYAKATYNSIHGPIGCSWKIDAGKLMVDVTIPANTMAAIVLPNPTGGDVLEGGNPVGQSEGIKLKSKENGTVTLEAGSGTYHFSLAAAAD